MRRGLLPAVLGAAVLLGGCAAAPASEPETTTSVRVFAAASLTDVFGRIAGEFEDAHPGVEVELNFGGSSGLSAQLVEGAPADVFAAASEDTMAIVADAGLLAAPPVVFARNRLEIAVPPGNPAGVTGLADLARPELTVALCDAGVPCGAAAAEVFDALGVAAAADTLEQDVKAVLTKVRLGEVDAGLVYRTDVLAAGDEVEGIPFPEAEAAVTAYPIAVVADAATPESAEAFVRWVIDDSGALLEEAGFAAP
ncbi:molybdate ABC transporter substrate-binding protein [Naasia sp. SYSU D00948]|uniref:molybdate ABC transporter substrate-binding protein n=1 Tax=Naasia sp. SYSU D00948 TaxID=2817379 RepID=UPI001B313670|nr:molybdate ABC transporter substrate-binding protein [Naasia sp. SYSU D00948]